MVATTEVEEAQNVDGPRPKLENAADAKAFQPSTFAERKAAAQKLRDELGIDETRPRMVRIGRNSHMMKDRKNRDIYVEGDLYMEREHAMRRWVRFDHDGTWHALFDMNSQPPKPEPIGEFKRKSVFPVTTPAITTPPPEQP